MRVLVRLVDEEDLFTVLAATGLDLAVRRAGVHQHPGQPATVPLQGHDLAADQLWRIVHHRRQCFTVGLLLAITRRNPFLTREALASLRGTPRSKAKAHDRARVSRHYVLAAGGTGGHLMPAFALASELERRGHHVALITDERGAAIPGKPDFLHRPRPARRALRQESAAAGPQGIAAVIEGRSMALRLFESFAAERGGRLRRLSRAARPARRKREAAIP